ncbi:MAG: hypothetical protein LBE91_14370 [Tannerella sp.]|jgi:hypothetical protein|nr:hypothetical protein [Tannerella sp.]
MKKLYTLGIIACMMLFASSIRVQAQQKIDTLNNTWYLNKQSAIEAATSQKKQIFVCWGRTTCWYTSNVRQLLGTGELKHLVDSAYILWFVNGDLYSLFGNETGEYFLPELRGSSGIINLPVLCLVNPNDVHKSYGFSTGSRSQSQLMDVLDNGIIVKGNSEEGDGGDDGTIDDGNGEDGDGGDDGNIDEGNDDGNGGDDGNIDEGNDDGNGGDDGNIDEGNDDGNGGDDGDKVANEIIRASNAEAYISLNKLIIDNTAENETVSVYSITGSLIDRFSKTGQNVSRITTNYPPGILIISGSSGWTKKVIKTK